MQKLVLRFSTISANTRIAGALITKVTTLLSDIRGTNTLIRNNHCNNCMLQADRKLETVFNTGELRVF